MNRKQITAFVSAGAMTLCTGVAMLAISGFSMLKQPAPAASVAPASSVQNAALATDPQVQQLQQAVVQYQAREQQYQQALDQAKARLQQDEQQLQQDQQQLQQFQQLLVMLQQRGIITLREGDGG
jgi:membrane-bound lytic murein transglycosylase B